MQYTTGIICFVLAQIKGMPADANTSTNNTVLAFNSSNGKQAILLKWIDINEKVRDISAKFDQSNAEAIFACSVTFRGRPDLTHLP